MKTQESITIFNIKENITYKCYNPFKDSKQFEQFYISLFREPLHKICHLLKTEDKDDSGNSIYQLIPKNLSGAINDINQYREICKILIK